MSVFLRQLQHLLPRSTAWRLAAQSTLRKLFEGLSAAPSDVRDFVDAVFEDAFPSTTRELQEFEAQFGIQVPTGSIEADRRAALAAAWMSRGGQSPGYLQGILQAAGFDLWIHEWWQVGVAAFEQVQCGEPLAQCGEPRAQCGVSLRRFVRDPTLYTDAPLTGTIQCGEPAAQCGEPAAMANRFLANDPGYLVNDRLVDAAPPPIPTDPLKWRHFFYVGAQTFPVHAEVPAARRSELERLILKLRPTQQWVVMLVDYV